MTGGSEGGHLAKREGVDVFGEDAGSSAVV